MLRMAGIGVLMFGLAGCIDDLGPTGDVLARDAAKSVVNSVVATRFPGVNAAPLTDCIIDNATGAEVVQLAEGALLGVTPETTNLVTEIAARPETVRCTAKAALGL